jgi:hypothetical protein
VAIGSLDGCVDQRPDMCTEACLAMLERFVGILNGPLGLSPFSLALKAVLLSHLESQVKLSLE